MKTNLLFSRILIGMSLVLFGITFSACETNSGKKPKVITGEATVDPASGTVKCNGYVETAGSSAVFDRGICYTSEDKKPTLKDKHASAGDGLGDFVCTLSNIKEGSYKYCAYASNEAGTAYGDTLVFVMTEKTNNGGENGGNNGGENGGNNGGANDSELKGSYLKVGDNVTAISTASFEMTYYYAVNPAYQTYTSLRFFDNSFNVLFFVGGNSLNTTSSLPTGEWYYSDTRTNYHSYWAWGCPSVKSSTYYSAMDYINVKQLGNGYIIDCTFNKTNKLHYEGLVQHSSKTEYHN